MKLLNFFNKKPQTVLPIWGNTVNYLKKHHIRTNARMYKKMPAIFSSWRG